MAISRGMPVGPDPDAPTEPVQLPTTNLFALRGLLLTGRLTSEQEPVARRMLADAAAEAREAANNPAPPTPQLPGDAA